ncbi:polysaccharide biosynthesis/export family protein, partial [Vibrio parahaemolyticus V-223/04]
TTLNY